MSKTKKKIGKYELVSKIAQGGMGAVFKAKHPTLNRYVLLKKLTLRGSSQFVERFKREARIMMDFKHDHIVHVYDHFKEGSSYYIAEEFVDGISLDKLIKRERYLSNEAAALILFEVCKGLQHAHEKGVVHRDIKPGNILISNQGDVKLVDFGIATSLEDTEDGLTREGMTLGTPSYIPPEQIDNAKSVDRRADIYSLGVVLYEMLTGKTPFPGSFTAETIALIHKGKYTPPKKLNPNIAPLLQLIVRRSMKPKRNNRFQDLRQIIRRLQRRIKRRDPASIKRAIKRIVQGREPGDVYKKKRSWVFFLLLCVFAALVLAGGLYYLYIHGYHHELLHQDRYGSIVASARIPSSYKDPADIYMSAVIFRELEGELVRVEGIDLNFHENKSRESEESYILESDKLYLETGRYRVKMNLEGQLYWETLYINPRRVQRTQIDTAAAQRVDISLVQTPALPLEVRYSATDIGSGEDLSDSTIFSVFEDDRWVRWNPWLAQRLTTGASYRFRFERSGYYPQSFNLLIKPYQTLLQLHAQLVPRPGTLRIVSDAQKLSFLLNDTQTYTSGGLDRRSIKIEPLRAETRELVLDPGEYLVTVAASDELSRSLTVPVPSEAVVVVNVYYDESEQTLELSIEK
jgi:serine/threonine protein kinase